jgi:hypothetical protein
MISRTEAMKPERSTTASPKYTDQINCTAVNLLKMLVVEHVTKYG